MTRRLVTLFNKEVLDLMRNRAALVPIVVAAAIALAMPFSITILVPAFAGQPLGGDLELLRISRLADTGEALRPLASRRHKRSPLRTKRHPHAELGKPP